MDHHFTVRVLKGLQARSLGQREGFQTSTPRVIVFGGKLLHQMCFLLVSRIRFFDCRIKPQWSSPKMHFRSNYVRKKTYKFAAI